jgi:hypothetical protein
MKSFFFIEIPVILKPLFDPRNVRAVYFNDPLY